ncbi:NTP transferase domain-containing protein [Zhihengliuella flava]|uniref:Molybdopterin-guanine dinucleotide biosynthesis protein A n=1 Tax=Zhihengliuella flava TaxID=1285193 RepID=A0A931DAY4_9MICC|nr:NTP transferase domain-containing protein [Zhihengliuella flava]MBG6085243.1 molybdopterin-guanine dinucleotide biosynthesis protein A [Zhihengliuella flava]
MERVPEASGRLAGVIILAGGRGQRLGGVDKAGLDVGGTTLLERAIGSLAVAHACAPGAHVVVVGPDRSDVMERLRQRYSRVPFTVDTAREEPTFAGPAAAVAAGSTALRAIEGSVLVLAVDYLHPRRILQHLASAAPSSSAVLIPRDATGREQPLASLWPAPVLRRAVELLDAGHGVVNASMRQLLETVERLAADQLQPPQPDLFADADTWEDVERARADARARTEEETMPEDASPSHPGPDATAGALEAWVQELLEAFELQEAPVDIEAILSLAGVAAHTVIRPAAPVTTYIAGYAAGLAAARDGAGDAAKAADGLARHVLAQRAATDAALHTDPES